VNAEGELKEGKEVLFLGGPGEAREPHAAEAPEILSRTNFNAHTIAEFRRNHGRVGGNFEGAPLLLLHTIGKRTGKVSVNPMMYMKDGDRYLVFASKAGADSHPDWFLNLMAHPDTQAEIGDETIDVHAEQVKGAERDRLYARHAAAYPAFNDYQRKTKRTIPVVALTRRRDRSSSSGGSKE
jgi:deazaflavin-dependent oxidoreductase (nitroreductase family)